MKSFAFIDRKGGFLLGHAEAESPEIGALVLMRDIDGDRGQTAQAVADVRLARGKDAFDVYEVPRGLELPDAQADAEASMAIMGGRYLGIVVVHTPSAPEDTDLPGKTLDVLRRELRSPPDPGAPGP